MQRRTIRPNYIRKKRRIFFILILLLFIGIIVLITLFLLSKKTLLISPVSSNRALDSKKIESLLNDAQIAFAVVSLQDDSTYKVTLENGSEIILSLKKNIEKQITSLQPILKQLTIDGKKFNRIDFRYDKPLVDYE